jgi:hypothetical protein
MSNRPESGVTESGELAVHIVSVGGANDHVLLLARDAAGIRVREWHPGNWSTRPVESVVTANTLLTRLEEVVRNRQRIEPDVRMVRSWIAGTQR